MADGYMPLHLLALIHLCVPLRLCGFFIPPKAEYFIHRKGAKGKMAFAIFPMALVPLVNKLAYQLTLAGGQVPSRCEATASDERLHIKMAKPFLLQ